MTVDLGALTALGVAQLIGWSLVGMVAASAFWVTFAEQHRQVWADVEVSWWLWHWYTGAPLETGRVAGYDGAHRVRNVARRGGLSVGRTVGTAGLVVAVYVQSGAPSGTAPVTLAAWGIGTTVGLTAAAVAIAHLAVRVYMDRRWIRPLHHALYKEAAWDVDAKPRRYITYPRLREHGGDGIIVGLGREFAPRHENIKKVVEIVRAKLDLPEETVSHKPQVVGGHRYLQFRPREQMEDVFRFTDDGNQKLIEAKSTDSKLVFGLKRGGDPMIVDLDRDSPHILCSAGSGGGKSVMLTGLIAQLMWHGADVTVIDFKRHSLMWLKEFPGVRYARDVGDIEDTLIEMAAEADRRNRAWDPVRFEDRHNGPKFKRHVLVCEELSSTMDELRDEWKAKRSGRDPDRSPAIKALRQILNMGRAVRIHVLAVAQRADANAVGDGGQRENYAVRVLVRHTPQTWKMLVSDCEFQPKSNHPGRGYVCVGSTATETQLLFMTEEDAWEWVRDKRGLQPRDGVIDVDVAAVAASPGDTGFLGESTGHVAPVAALQPGPPVLANGVEPVTLWEASIDKGKAIVALSYDALRKAEERDPQFPPRLGQRPSGGWLFDPIALQRWERNRPVAKTNGTTAVGHQVGTVGDGTDDDGRQENDGSAEEVPQGDYPLGKPSRRDRDRDRFHAKVDRRDETGCYLWTGYVDKDGYPQFTVTDDDGRQRTVKAHRWIWEDEVGPIPEGYTIDHLIGPDGPCTSRACVFTDHLEPVPHAENLSRGHARRQAQQGAATS